MQATVPVKAIKAALLCVSNETQNRYSMEGVQITVNDLETTIIGTDGHRLLAVTVPNLNAEPGTVIINGDDLAVAVRIKGAADIRINGALEVIDKWDRPLGTIPFLPIELGFPPTNEVIPNDYPAEGLADIGIVFTPEYLEDAGKIGRLLCDPNAPRMRCRFTYPDRQAAFETSGWGGTSVYILMPQR